MQKVCIIGAGASGIAAAKTLHQNGIDFDCFEKGSKIGGLWRYENDNGLSSVYKSLHINTNRDLMAFSDYPMPKDYPMFPHHSLIIDYFEDYVRYFAFGDKITFNTSVVSVSKNTDGSYHVTTDTGISQDYRAVLVCNGHHWNPRFPSPPFAGNFTGETMHSHYYKTPDIFQGKNVLVVGIGNSAVDIACEAARQYSGKVFISTRSGAYILPNWFWGMPFDKLASPLTSILPFSVQRTLLRLSLWLARGSQENYGVPTPKRKPLSEHPTISQDLLNLTGRGLIKIKPNIKELQCKKVLFDDGTTQDVDLLIYATGYKITFPFFKHESMKTFDNVENNNSLNLYKKMIHPDYAGLYFIGLMQPLGAIMPLSEWQAKWVAQILLGKSIPPSPAEMRHAIEKDKQELQTRYGNHSPRHTLQVDFFSYIRSVKKEMV